MLSRSPANRADDAEFAEFCCCDSDAPAWEVEAENYVRASALGHSEHVLAMRNDDGLLVAVSAFTRRDIEIVPVAQPTQQVGWHLQVMAVRLEHQRQGVCGEAFALTFEAMRELDDRRGLITAHVHKDHGPSLAACEKVGLERLMPLGQDEDYWVLLGTVPGLNPSMDD